MEEGLSGGRGTVSAGGGGDAFWFDAITFIFKFVRTGAFLDFSQLTEIVEIQGRVGIDIVHMVSNVGGFRNEEDEEKKLDDDEGQANVEIVVPAEVGGDGSSNDGDTVGNSCENKVDY